MYNSFLTVLSAFAILYFLSAKVSVNFNNVPLMVAFILALYLPVVKLYHASMQMY